MAARARSVPVLSILALSILAPAGSAPAGELCLAPNPENGNNLTRRCGNLDLYMNDYLGYSETGSPCNSTPTAVECFDIDYEIMRWSISASDQDPWVNTGPLGGGPARLYLWLPCVPWSEGWLSAEFALVGDLEVTGFVPRNGFVNHGTATALTLENPGLGCIHDVLVGEILIGGALSVEPDVDSAPWGRVKAIYR